MFKQLTITMAAGVLLSGCLDETQDRGERTQEEVMERAASMYPVPKIENFLTRKQLVKWVNRQDVPERPHYIYLLSDVGNLIGYYVGQSRPVCTSTFLTPPQRIRGSGSRVTYKAPALDGTYYGDGPCDQYFFFDAETDAMVEITGVKFITMDQPLDVNVEEFSVNVNE